MAAGFHVPTLLAAWDLPHCAPDTRTVKGTLQFLLKPRNSEEQDVRTQTPHAITGQGPSQPRCAYLSLFFISGPIYKGGKGGIP